MNEGLYDMTQHWMLLDVSESREKKIQQMYNIN